MNDFLPYLAFRTIFIFASTAFSLIVIMLALNIITIDEVISILGLEGSSADALRLVISRIQEVTGNIIEIISQLLGKLFGWAGVEVDLSKVNVDVNQEANSVPGGKPKN
jgi:hypothetical protein